MALSNDETLKALYDTVKPEDAVDYEHFRRKIRRLEQGNPATINRLLRGLGLIEPAKKGGGRQGRGPSKFISYDGEGYGDRYTLLANSEGDYIANDEGLNSEECLEFLTARYEFRAKRIWYAFGYDVNHIIRDLPSHAILKLHANEIVHWHGYKLQYYPGKIFIVNGQRYSDMFTFFARSFVKTVELMLGPEAVTDRLREGKAARGTFETWDREKILQYNAEELDMLVRIANKLRDALLGIDVNLTSWYGPGAIANYWMRKHGIAPDEYPPEVEDALSRSYYGGRFEQIKLGYVKPVYEYDIRSAYPTVMAGMPNFRSWLATDKYEPNPHSIWHVEIDLRQWYLENEGHKRNGFLPLPMRSRNGRICFPLVIRGWYWQSEIQLVLDFFPNARVAFDRGYIADTEGLPFDWVADLYDYRRSLKQSGNLSEYALKVGLNSLYGKTAQRVGKNQFHSLAWAGFITSTARAKLGRAGYEGAYKNPATNASKIIGFATDALFSSERLTHLKLGDNLGDWEETKVANGLFFQSGVYRLSNWGDDPIDRYRGSPLRKGIDDIVEQIKTNPENDPEVRIGRFISNLLAIRAPNTFGPVRLQFVQIKHQLQLAAPFKRHYHFPGKLVPREGKLLPAWRANFSTMLDDIIYSSPKIWMNDPIYIPQLYDIMLESPRLFNDEESYPTIKRPLQVIDEEQIASTLDYSLRDVESLDTLPTIKGEVEIVT